MSSTCPHEPPSSRRKCGGKRSDTALDSAGVERVRSALLQPSGNDPKRRRRCALPAQSKTSRVLERECLQQGRWWSAPALWSAAGSEAPRRFGFFRRGTHDASVSRTVRERSKAASPLRSAGALQKLAASFAHGMLHPCLKKRRPGHTLRHISFQFAALISSPPEHISKPTTSAVRNDCACFIVVS